MLSWNGRASNADATHASRLFVQNTATGAWDEAATADENGSMAVRVPVKDHVQDGTATVMVQCTADSALPDFSIPLLVDHENKLRGTSLLFLAISLQESSSLRMTCSSLSLRFTFGDLFLKRREELGLDFLSPRAPRGRCLLFWRWEHCVKRV